MNGGPRRNAVGFQRIIVRQLFATVNEFDLVYTHSFAFLQGLLHGQHLVRRFEIVRLFAAGQGFDVDLTSINNMIRIIREK